MFFCRKIAFICSRFFRKGVFSRLISEGCCRFSIKYQALNDNNSEEFNASFVLELCKPLPAAVGVVQKIYEAVCKPGKKEKRTFAQ